MHKTTHGFSFGPVSGLVIFGIALLMAGCPGGGEQKKDPPKEQQKVEPPVTPPTPTESSEEKLAKEHLDILNKMLGHFNAITDPATFKQEAPLIKALQGELAKNKKKIQELPEDRRVVAEKLYVAQSQSLNKAITAEMKRASTFSKGQGRGPPGK